MELDRLRSQLPQHLLRGIDLDAEYRRYRAGGGFEVADEFAEWLAAQHPARAGGADDSDVEVTCALPQRFAAAIDSTRIAPGHGTAPASRPDGGNFHYVMLGTAGSGGMGTVHVARDTELMRRVALKTLNEATASTPGGQARFLREVQITAQLSHPNIVAVYALELTPQGQPAYTMKLVEGDTFQSLLNGTKAFYEDDRHPDDAHSLSARLEHFLKVCDAIAYAHDKGVIHRDLKPGNLMLGRHNEVYVMDWGLCRLLGQPAEEVPAEASRLATSPEISGGASETQAGDVVGTPKYMSPEQAQGRNHELDARSDQCALGLILFELVTLTSPYPGRNAYEVMVNAAMGRRRPVQSTYRKVRIARELRAIIERATAASPGDRYDSVAAFAADVRRFVRGEAVLAQPDTVIQRVQRWAWRRRQTMLTAVLATFALAATAIGWLLWRSEQQAVTARAHETSVIALHDAVSRVGDRVQTRFVQLEGAMKNLADSIAQASDYGAGNDARYYLQRTFGVADGPQDLVASTLHSGRVSLQWPAWSIPATISEADAAAFIRRVAPVQPFVREVYRRAAAMIRDEDGNYFADAVPVVSDDDSAIMAIAIGFDNGVYMRYPGWDALPGGYDPRQRPWYRIDREQALPVWGEPYRSSISGLVELSLSVPMIDGNDRFVGVATALLLPDKIVQALFEVRVPGVLGLYLLDRDGDIVAHRGKLLGQADDEADAGKGVKFPNAQMIERIAERRGGVVRGTLLGHDVLMAFDIIAPIGWAVVAVADEAALFEGSPSKP